MFSVPGDLTAVADNLKARGESSEVLRKLEAVLASPDEDRSALHAVLRLLPNDIHPAVDPKRSVPLLVSTVGRPRDFKAEGGFRYLTFGLRSKSCIFFCLFSNLSLRERGIRKFSRIKIF
jgi:hypothetical protein